MATAAIEPHTSSPLRAFWERGGVNAARAGESECIYIQSQSAAFVLHQEVKRTRSSRWKQIKKETTDLVGKPLWHLHHCLVEQTYDDLLASQDTAKPADLNTEVFAKLKAAAADKDRKRRKAGELERMAEEAREIYVKYLNGGEATMDGIDTHPSPARDLASIERDLFRSRNLDRYHRNGFNVGRRENGEAIGFARSAYGGESAGWGWQQGDEVRMGMNCMEILRSLVRHRHD